MNFSITYYEKENGEQPVENFILSQNKKMQAKIFRLLLLLEEFGYALREPYSKAVGDGIFEIRARHGSDITRVLYFFTHNSTIVLTNGFVKKTNKTPSNEIQIAKEYRNHYLKGVNYHG